MYFSVHPKETETLSNAPATPAESQGRSVITLYLSVFVILLAFFIVLYALSQNEPGQTHSVMSSVSRHFQAPPMPPGGSPKAGSAASGAVAGSEGSHLFLSGGRSLPLPLGQGGAQSPYQSQLADAVSTAVPTAALVMLADDVLEARMRADSLFFSENARIRPGREELVDRLVAVLASPPPGLVYEMEFRVGTDYDSTKSLLGDMVGNDASPDSAEANGGAVADPRQLSRARMTLALARAGTFARLVIGRGASPQTVAVGVDPGLPDEIRLVFRLRAGRP